jgi:hypothetical protein
MAAGPRVALQAIPFNNAPLTGLFVTSTTPGYDTGSPGGTMTGWSSNLGVYVPNPSGNVILAYACGATAAGAFQVLVGDLVGGTGQVLPATTEAGTIAANTQGWIGPFSPATFNQQAPTNVTYSGAINTQALVAATQGCLVIDFSTTTTLAVRAYSLNPIQP